ncbi:MAG TPA: plasmid pRiA4b ORF-3 family protein [Gemmataceae bacterium]
MSRRTIKGSGEKKQIRTKAVSKERSARRGRDSIFQVKIMLNVIKPPIWRRVQVKDGSLAELHDIIQTCMGWDDYHLHVFKIGGEQYGLPEQWQEPGGWGEPEVGDSRKIKLSQLVAQGIKKFRYVYDMGDTWEHTIQIEKTLPAETGVQYPRCIDGKRACPPEDCGGPWSYGDFLEALQDPQHPRHEDRLEWIGGEFDSEAFNLDEVNAELH